MTQHNNGKPLSRIAKALHEQIPDEQQRRIYREVCIIGRRPAEVAKAANLSENRVNAIVYRVRKWLEQVTMPINFRALQALHLQRLEHQWHEAMSAWYRSGSKDETVKVALEEGKQKTASPSANGRAKPASGEGKRKVEKTTRETYGDVRYLEQARKIMAEFRSLSAEAQAAQAKEKADAQEDRLPLLKPEVGEHSFA